MPWPLLTLLPVTPRGRYAIATDEFDAPSHSTRRVPTRERERDDARVVKDTREHEGRDGGATARRRGGGGPSVSEHDVAPMRPAESPRRPAAAGPSHHNVPVRDLPHPS